MRTEFGSYVRQRRERLRDRDAAFSVRGLAARIGVEPSYLSKVERSETPPPSEATIGRLAQALGEDRDVLLALAGKVSTDLQAVIRKRPRLFAELLRELKDQPDHAVLRIVREIRDGEW
jgi:transcriptional regulator with XRE-family HTH domain